jgi:hypothetical protein
MAYLRKNLEEEGVKSVAQGSGVPAQSGVAPRTTSGQTADIQPGQPSGQAPGAATGGPSPTGYIPLQQYLQANVGAGAGVKNILGGQVEQTASAAEKEIGGVQTAGTTAAQKAQSEAEKQGSQVRADLAWNPSANVEKAKGFLEQTYQGPESSPYAAQVKAAQETAKGKIGLLSSEEGKQAALQGAVKGPYSAGYGSLDRYLFAQDPGAKAQFEAQQKLASDKVYRTGAGAQQAIDAQVEFAKQKLKEQQKNIQKTAAEEKSYRDYLKTKEMLQKNQNLYGKEGGQKASLGDVTNAQELADLEALAAISGQNLNEGYRQRTYAEGRIPEKMIREETRGVLVPQSQVVGQDSKGKPITEWERKNVLT